MVATRSQQHDDHAFPPKESRMSPGATTAVFSGGKRKNDRQSSTDAGSGSSTKRQKTQKTASNRGNTPRTLAAVVIPAMSRDTASHQGADEGDNRGAQQDITPALESLPSAGAEALFLGRDHRGDDGVEVPAQHEGEEAMQLTLADREEPVPNNESAPASTTKATLSPSIKTKRYRKRDSRRNVTSVIDVSPRAPAMEPKVEPEPRHKRRIEVTSTVNPPPHASIFNAKGRPESRHKRFGNEETTSDPPIVPLGDPSTKTLGIDDGVDVSKEDLSPEDPPSGKPAMEGTIEDFEAESSSDESPEVVTKTSGLEKVRTAAAEATKAAEAQRAAGKQKRRERDRLLKLQAKSTKREAEQMDAQESSHAVPTRGDMEDSSSPPLSDSPNGFTWSSRDALPTLLPDEILAAEPAIRFPTPSPERVVAKAPINKRQRFLEETSKRPKDIKKALVNPLKWTVTFSPQITVNHSNTQTSHSSALRPPQQSSSALSNSNQAPVAPPVLSTFNSKLRRRNSHGSPLSAPPMLPPAPKIGPQRTTKNAQKLKLLPNPDLGDDGPDEESGRDVYSQFTRIKDPTARRDAARLGKADRDKLPRVTAYCTASAYRLEGAMKFLKSRARTRGANPKLFDECIYSPYSYSHSRMDNPPVEDNINSAVLETTPSDRPTQERRYSDSAVEVEETTHHRREELLDLHTAAGDTALDSGSDAAPNHHSLISPDLISHPHLGHENTLDFDTRIHAPEIFLFDYGTVVIWGMTPAQETRFLHDISKFSTGEPLSPADIQTENFNFYYTREYQARIYNDFISLREKKNYMTKLAISHALSQSVKTSLFEDLLSTTIARTHPLPQQLAVTGRIALSRTEINKQIGQLFILRINIHLQGSVLDSPELMWAEPQLEPVYGAVRSYLEMDQRVGLLTERLEVLGDLLAVLKDQVGTRHGEYLEWIVIVLIAAEILVAAINIVVDLYAGVD
ncbi:MAG: hypothetical protein LQ345_004390 [Seirophora villosa]|nr:MAG: hypothetical protein LQ345_004390 [Seirophora villosa]